MIRWFRCLGEGVTVVEPSAGHPPPSCLPQSAPTSDGAKRDSSPTGFVRHGEWALDTVHCSLFTVQCAPCNCIVLFSLCTLLPRANLYIARSERRNTPFALSKLSGNGLQSNVFVPLPSLLYQSCCCTINCAVPTHYRFVSFVYLELRYVSIDFFLF